MPKIRWQFSINGTDVNPWHKWDLTQNPFPQHGEYELNASDMAIQSLGGDPIKSGDDIRKRLKGVFSEQFIVSVIEHFKPGVMVECDVTCEW